MMSHNNTWEGGDHDPRTPRLRERLRVLVSLGDAGGDPHFHQMTEAALWQEYGQCLQPLTDAQKSLLEDIVFTASLNGIPMLPGDYDTLRDDLYALYEDLYPTGQDVGIDLGFVSDEDLAAAIAATA